MTSAASKRFIVQVKGGWDKPALTWEETTTFQDAQAVFGAHNEPGKWIYIHELYGSRRLLAAKHLAENLPPS